LGGKIVAIGVTDSQVQVGIYRAKPQRREETEVGKPDPW